MPDANQIAASHDAVQMLFYFVCALALAIGAGIAWFAKYMLIPMRDRGMKHLDYEEAFMARLEKMVEKQGDNTAAQLQTIVTKINCPPHHETRLHG